MGQLTWKNPIMANPHKNGLKFDGFFSDEKMELFFGEYSADSASNFSAEK